MKAKIILSLILFFLFLVPYSYASRSAVLIDAGSSGTRVYVYRVNQFNHQYHLIELGEKKIQPGLSAFAKADTPITLKAYITQLLSYAQTTLQTNHIKPREASFRLAATAGMRLLPKNTQQAIYTKVINIINNTHQFTHVNESSVRTITGQQEALYAWLSTNLRYGYINHHTPSHGILEIGGASAQIAFQTPTKSNYTYSLDGKKTKLFLHSWLGLGMNELSRQIHDSTCYPMGYHTQKIKSAHFDFSECQKALKHYLSHYHIQQLVSVPKKRARFIGIGHHFKSVLEYLHLPYKYSPASILLQTKLLCNNPKHTLSWFEHNTTLPKKLAWTACIRPVYLYVLLKELKFADNETIEPAHITWTEGLLLSLLSSPSS